MMPEADDLGVAGMTEELQLQPGQRAQVRHGSSAYSVRSGGKFKDSS